MKEKLLAMTMSAMILLTAVPVIAGEFPQGAQPGNDEPQIYLIKKIFVYYPQLDFIKRYYLRKSLSNIYKGPLMKLNPELEN